MTSKNKQQLLDRAIAAGCEARLLTQKRGGYRRYSCFGSTYVPERVIMIDGTSMSFGRARSYLRHRECSEKRVEENEPE